MYVGQGVCHTIIKHTERSRTYGEHLRRILSLLRRTYIRSTVNNSNNRPNITPHRSYTLAPAISPGGLFCSGKFFRALKLLAPAGLSAQPELSARRPPSLRVSPDPSSQTLEPTTLDSHGFPQLHPNVLIHVYPEMAGIPKYRGRLSPHCRIFRRHQHLPPGCQPRSPECSTNILMPLYIFAGLFRTPSRTLRNLYQYLKRAPLLARTGYMRRSCSPTDDIPKR